MEIQNQADFYDKNSYHSLQIKFSNFCTICYNYTNHNTLDCPYKCSKCNGFHKTCQHRCLICNVKNPNHNTFECKYIYFKNQNHV